MSLVHKVYFTYQEPLPIELIEVKNVEIGSIHHQLTSKVTSSNKNNLFLRQKLEVHKSFSMSSN